MRDIAEWPKEAAQQVEETVQKSGEAGDPYKETWCALHRSI